MWGFIGGFFGKVLTVFTGRAWIIWLIAGALAAGFGGGWYVAEKFSDAEKAKLYEQAAIRQAEAVRRTIDQYETILIANEEVIGEYVGTVNDIRRQERIVYKEVINYVPVEDSHDCNVPIGVVGVLNLARTGDAKWEEMLPSSGSALEAARAPSPVTRREEYEAHAGCGIAYQELAARYNSLVDWIERAYQE